MKNRVLLITLIGFFNCSVFATSIKTGLYLILTEYGQDPATTTPVLDPDFEFTQDLGDGYYSLSFPITKIGVEDQKLSKSFKVYDSNKKVFSDFHAQWSLAQSFHYAPSKWQSKEVIFVVNSNNLYANYNGEFGVVGCKNEWVEAFTDLKMLHETSMEAGVQYVWARNDADWIWTGRYSSNVGVHTNGNTFHAEIGAWHHAGDNPDLFRYEPEGYPGAKRLLNEQFGFPAEGAVVARVAYNLKRLRFCVFNEANEFAIGEDKFKIMGDKYVLRKKFPAGTHNITVSANFNMEEGTPSSFNLEKESLVELWFYADTNPNKDNNLHIVKDAIPYETLYPNVDFAPVYQGRYIIQSLQNDTKDNLNYIGLSGDSFEMTAAENLTDGTAQENSAIRNVFFSNHFYPGDALRHHGENMFAIMHHSNWSPATGALNVGNYESGYMVNNAPYDYWSVAKDMYQHRALQIKRFEIKDQKDIYALITTDGKALTNSVQNGEKRLKVEEFTQAPNQLWLITSEDNFNGFVDTSISQKAVKELNVYSANRQIVITGINNRDKVELYDLQGRLVVTQVANDDHILIISATPGIYIVRINDIVKKVVIK